MKKNILILFSFVVVIFGIGKVDAALKKSVEIDGFFDAKFKVEWHDYENASGTRPDSFELSLIGATNKEQTKATISKDNCDTTTNPNVWDCVVRFDGLRISNIKMETEYSFYSVNNLPENYYSRDDYSRFNYKEEHYDVLYNEGTIIIIANAKRFYDFNVVFDDANNRDGLRPWILQYTLSNQDDSFHRSIQIMPAREESYLSTPDGFEYKISNWKFSANLYPYLIVNDKPDFSKPAEYSLSPNIRVEGYDYTVDKNDNVYTLNYKYNAKKLDYNVDVNVVFEDNIYKKPNDLELTLYTENEANVKTVKVNDKNNWKYSFTDLYLNDLNLDPDYNSNPKEAVYKVSIKDNKDYEYDITGSQKDGYTVFVKYVGDRIYKLLSGDNQTYIKKSNKPLIFKIDADYSYFKDIGKVYVDDKLLSNNDYTSKEGSTVIELNSSYLDSLDDKEHTLKVVFSNGEAITKFNVVSKNEVKSISNNPNTSDNIIKYVLIAVGSVGGIAVIILCIKLFNRKKES